MKDSDLEIFLNEVKKTLGNTIHQSGTLLYSSANTLKKGKYLILGLNPGGNPNTVTTTILESFENLLDPDYNAYYEDWNNGKPHRLQINLKEIANTLNTDLRGICATNIIFTRSKGESGIDWQNLPQCMKIIDRIINIVSPEIIITFGGTPYYKLMKFFRDQGKDIHEEADKPSGHGKWMIRVFKLKEGSLKVIGLPHLSVYTIYNRTDVLRWLTEEASA